MKKLNKSLNTIVALVLLMALLALSSCTSFSELVRLQMEGLPTWVLNPNVPVHKTAFVGKGSTAVLFNAKLMAYEDILSQLSDFVGEPLGESYYRELTTTDGLEAFSLHVVNEYSKTDNRSSSQYYLLATADTAKLESTRTSFSNAMLQRDRDITSLLQQADVAYRANNDLEAIKLYLDAASIASEGPVSNKKHEVEALLAKSVTFLNSLRFSLGKNDPSKGTATVLLRRKSRLLSPKVLHATVVASFNAVNSLGIPYSDTLSFQTATEGQIQFVPYNYGIVGQGSILFRVDLDASLEKLRQSLPPESIAPLETALSECSLEFHYSLVSKSSSKRIIADIHEYEFTGALRDSKISLHALQDIYKERGINITASSLSQEDETDLFAEISQKGIATELVLQGKAGVVDETIIGDQTVVVVNGNVQLWDVESKLMLGETLEVEAVAFAPEAEEAKRKAFLRFGQISSALLLRLFF